MSFDKAAFQQLRSNRLAYVDGLRKNAGFEAGILKLLTQLYPDNAHFIYELLQNAEDAEATHARFTLSKESLVFEHDGKRLFSARNVESITSIGNSTKANSPTEIGKFGVGFKAVFAYTQTPEIHSGEYHFCIRDLVVPKLLESSYLGTNGFKTKFVFPFDHPKKSSRQATLEITAALQALDDATLLFLSNICRISYVLPDGSEGQLERVLPSDLQQARSKGEHIEVSVQSPAGEPRRSHWLRYREVVTIDDESTRKDCTVAVAFGLEEAEGRSQKSQWRVVPLSPGRVCIYFPAEKETSNLRFHMHAPFASTVARDSVRDSPGNDQLVAALAALAAETMEDIRDRGLLTVAALESLPINDDNLSPFYAPVRARIVEAFKSKHLVPTKSGTHRMAKDLFRGPSDIVNLINNKDLATLTGGKRDGPLWCANPPLVNQRADKFLDALEIEDWGWEQLCDALTCDHATLESEEDPTRPERLKGWLTEKDDAWLTRFYALLHDATMRHHRTLDVSGLALVRVDAESSTHMVKPVEAFFPPPDEALAPKDVLLVRPDTYSSGKSESYKNAARLFLEKAGVRVFDEEAELARVLDLYSGETFPDRKTHLDHIRRFIAFLQRFPHKAHIFQDETVLLGHKVGDEDDLDWCAAESLFLDLPFEETGLSAIEGASDKRMLWSGYEKVGPKKAFIEFVKALGIQADLPVVRTNTHYNRARDKLRADYLHQGGWRSDSGIDDDWTIKHIDTFFLKPTIESSRLLWATLTNARPEVAKAKFRPNRKFPIREEDSQLIWWLKNNAWIPDANGDFQRPQDISRDQLPPGFLFDDRNGLLSAIGFEEAVRQRSDEYKRKDLVARECGFDGLGAATELANALRESGIDPKTAAALIKQHAARPKQRELPEFKSFKEGIQSRHRVAVGSPSEGRGGAAPVSNPERYRQTTEGEIREALKNHETGRWLPTFSVIRNLPSNKSAREFLEQEYQGRCQVTDQTFQKSSGGNYFEALSLVSRLDAEYLNDAGNLLCLCPDMAARFMHGGFEWIDSFEDKVQAYKTEIEGGILEMRQVVALVAGTKVKITWTERHFLKMCALWNACT